MRREKNEIHSRTVEKATLRRTRGRERGRNNKNE